MSKSIFDSCRDRHHSDAWHRVEPSAARRQDGDAEVAKVRKGRCKVSGSTLNGGQMATIAAIRVEGLRAKNAISASLLKSHRLQHDAWSASGSKNIRATTTTGNAPVAAWSGPRLVTTSIVVFERWR